MPTASISTEIVDIFHLLPGQLKTRVDKWEVSGLDGYGAQTLGKGDAEFEFITVKYCNDNTAANTHLNNCIGFQGTVITITDDWADDYDNVLIEHVDVAQAKKPIIWTDSSNVTHTHGVRVEIHWKACISS